MLGGRISTRSKSYHKFIVTSLYGAGFYFFFILIINICEEFKLLVNLQVEPTWVAVVSGLSKHTSVFYVKRQECVPGVPALERRL